MGGGTGSRDPREALLYLAGELKVDLGSTNIAIATEGRPAKVKLYNGSLEAIVSAGVSPRVSIEAPMAPGIWVKPVDHFNNPWAPSNAIFEIVVYRPNNDDNTGTLLKGDISVVYVGHDGIIIDSESKKRIAESYVPKK